MKLWKIMTSRIEFITRGVKIMARISKVVKKTTKAAKKNQLTRGQKAAATRKKNQALAKARKRSRTAGLFTTLQKRKLTKLLNQKLTKQNQEN